MNKHYSPFVQEWRRQIIGLGRKVPLLNGDWVPYVNVDNAATTPALAPVRDRIVEFLDWYSSVHRGTGFKSRLSTWVYEESRKAILDFVGASDEHTAIFTKSTTEAINVLAHRLGFTNNDVIVSSVMEHHANLLPWRHGPKIVYLPIQDTGIIDIARFPEILSKYKDKVRMVAISGASNVTGYTPPIYEIARIVHQYSHAEIMVDAAQLGPHRRIHMGSLNDPSHIDYIAMSSHKMYAPFGMGVLIGPRRTFQAGEPYLRGGGAVKFVTLDSVEWDYPPEREEAGSPNVVGALAMATAAKTLAGMGMEHLENHERRLDQYLVQKLQAIEAIRILGNPSVMGSNRIGVVTFVIDEMPSMLVGAILGHEWGIGVRAGCFCAHPYLVELLGVQEDEVIAIRKELQLDDWTHVPAAVRVSLGLYNTYEEVDRLVKALKAVANREYAGQYVLNSGTSEYECAEAADLTWAFSI